MKILEETTLSGLTLKNRIVMEPMCMYAVANHDGVATPFHRAHYVSRAIAQVGLIIVEATGVVPEGRITDACLGLYNDTQMLALKEIVDDVHSVGGKIGIQLNHAGRKCTASEGVDRIVAPSAIPFDEKSRTPEALSPLEIEAVVKSFQDAALRALYAGFDCIEIHGAHGYLISQFMSPISNTREDDYQDGSVLIDEIVRAIRDVWPYPKPLLIRVSATDYEENGQDVNDTIAMLKKSCDLLDAINVSSGGITPIPPHSIYPGYQVGFAKKIREALSLPVIACGLLGSPDLASYLIESNTVDYIGLARPLLNNPHWVLEFANARREKDIIPYSYKRGFR